MVKRKNFVSDGLVTLRHKYVDEQLQSLRSDENISQQAAGTEFDENFSEENKYLENKNELDISLHEQLASLKAQIAEHKQSLNSCEASYDKLEFILKKITNLPHPDALDKNPEALSQLEQLRTDFLRVKAGCPSGKTAEPKAVSAPVVQNSQVSIIHELCSLNQVQMFKMGLYFALPLIMGIIIGCGMITWVMIFTFGR
jgi:hypothetical protein